MTSRFLLSVASVCVLGLAQRPIAAQVPAGAPQPAFKVLKSSGTPEEEPALRRITDRMRAKSADAAFLKTLDAAAARRDHAAARQLIADVAGVKASQVALALPAKVGSSDELRTPFAFTSNRSSRVPLMVLFHVGTYLVCIGGDDCDDLFRQLGYQRVY